MALIACIVVFELLQSNTALKNLGPWVPGPRVLGSLGPRSSGPGSSVYSVPTNVASAITLLAILLYVFTIPILKQLLGSLCNYQHDTVKLHYDLYVGVFSKGTHPEILGGNVCTPCWACRVTIKMYLIKFHKACWKGELAQWNNGATEDDGAGGYIHYGLVK